MDFSISQCIEINLINKMLRGQDRPPSSDLFVKHNVTTELFTLFLNTCWSHIREHNVFQRLQNFAKHLMND
jgi:hypothetical protein